MDENISFGVLVPIGKAQWGSADPRLLIDFALRAERLGFDSLWVNDSLVSPRIEALTMLAAAAPVTERVTLGTAALLPVLRRPVQTAQTLASIDLLSGGRLAVAVGAGFPGPLGQPMYELSEVPWPRRFARLDETVALWRQLWTTDGPSSFHGEFFSFDAIPPATRPHRPGGPPIWLGGATPAALGRTGRHYDGWLPYPPDPADYAAGLTQIEAAATPAGQRHHPGAVYLGADRGRRGRRPARAGRLRAGVLWPAAGAARADTGAGDRARGRRRCDLRAVHRCGRAAHRVPHRRPGSGHDQRAAGTAR